jgi:A/G-specific adenine glycosylase
LKIRERWLNYFLVRHKGEILIRQRISKDIWQGLFEFLLIETERNISTKKLVELFTKQCGIEEFILSEQQTKRQKLTHQLINFCILNVEIKQKQNIPGFVWTKICALDHYAFPKSLQEAVRNI